MYHLYSVLFSGLLAVGLPYWLYRSFREKGYGESLLERFGLHELAAPRAPAIWIHAVSVGEVIAVATLLPSLKKAFPDTPVVVSVITVTGRQVAADKLKAATEKLGHPERVAEALGSIADRGTGEAMVRTAVERFGSVDVLVNNAGTFGAKPFVDVTEEELDGYLSGNLKGTYLITQAAVRQMQ